MLLALLSALNLATLAAPAVATPPPTDEIVVQGEKQRTRVQKFVRQLTPAPFDGQLAKFLAPVCPASVGLLPEQNNQVADRIRQVSKAIGTDVAPQGCTVNLLVMVVPDKKVAIQQLRAKRPDLFGELPAAEIGRLESVPGPATAWQLIDVTGTDGMPLGSARLDATGDAFRIVRVVGTPSRIVKLTVPQFRGSVLIVESHALDGVSTRQLADYAVMRTLASVSEPSSALPADSILTLFNPGVNGLTAPLSVTQWDYAFLKSYYASSNSVVASSERHELQQRMQKELQKQAP
jgi:hypothetical protein